MERQYWRASNLLNPLPCALISCTDDKGHSNVMTAAWVGTICSDPVMVSVSIRKSRYSHSIIQDTKEFVINLTDEKLTKYADYVGIYSGKKIDKLNLSGEYKVTPIASKEVKAITLLEAPIALECKVKEILELGSHDCFIAEVVATSVREDCVDFNGKLNMKKCNLISYCHGEYYTLGKSIGRFGHSSFKKERSRRINNKNNQRKK